MSSSLSPDQYESAQSQSSPDGGSQNRGPVNLEFLKALNDKKTTREGNPPKRRGPKPDSKPALTRRQELNRQAQRTHRERKELYIKALEEEVLRLKEIFSTVSQDKEKLAEENKLLRDALAQNGLNIPRSNGPRGPGSQGGNGGDGGRSDETMSNQSGSYAIGSYNVLSPSQASQSTAPSASPGQTYGYQAVVNKNQMSRQPHQPIASSGVDAEQAGIDFVLALEKPCMVHLPFLMDRATEAGGESCGHALMASCPPTTFNDITPALPWGHAHTDGSEKTTGPCQGTWEISKADLATLLDLSGRLNLDGEITPVMAWGMILNHPGFKQLTGADFTRLTEELQRKVRCYGFGAVMEEFELRDAFNSVCSGRVEELAY